MKCKVVFLLFFGLAITFSCYARGTKFKLIWKENFKGTTFDAKRWSKIPRGLSDWNRHMSACEKLYEVKNGCLTLRGVVNDRVDEKDTARYLTGGLYTKDKFTIEYGKVEIRAKLQAAQGAWPAIWMLPNNGRWPDGGEIDIMERLNHDSIAYQTVHSYYTYILKEKNPKHSGIGRIRPDDYNVYAVEIYPDSLVFFINRQKTFSYPRVKTDKKGQYPFGIPYYLLIDMQIEGNWVGKAKPDELPVEMKIDWVKFYELKKKEKQK